MPLVPIAFAGRVTVMAMQAAAIIGEAHYLRFLRTRA
jgi:hypothetical protein